MKRFILAFLILISAPAFFTQPMDSIFTVISDDTIHIWNTGAFENCVSVFVMDAVRDNDTIIVRETDIATQYATCMCYFDLCISITGYPAGYYYIKVYRKLNLVNPNLWIFIGSTSVYFGGSNLSYQTFGKQTNCYDPSNTNNEQIIPTAFILEQNFPNPFNPNTVISYQLPVAGNVLLKVYDVLGNEISTLVNEEKPAGSYEVKFDASGLSSGVYFYRLQVGEFVQTRKMILLK